MQGIFVFPVLQRCTDQKTGWNDQAQGKENALTETFGSGKTRCRPVKEQKPETYESYSIGDDESQTLGDILELYDAGARYVIQTEFLAARGFREILDGEMGKSDKDAFRDLGQTHREETKKLQEGLGEIFAKA